MHSTNIVAEKSFSDSAGRDGTKVFRSGMVPILYCVSISSGRHAVSVAASNTVVLEGNYSQTCAQLLQGWDLYWQSERRDRSYFEITSYRRPKAPCHEVDEAKTMKS